MNTARIDATGPLIPMLVLNELTIVYVLEVDNGYNVMLVEEKWNNGLIWHVWDAHRVQTVCTPVCKISCTPVCRQEFAHRVQNRSIMKMP